MEYRITYNETEVLSSTENVATSITYTQEKYFVGELNEAITFFRRLNIDYTQLLETYSITEKELFSVNISSITEGEDVLDRKVAVLSMPIDFSQERIDSTMLIITTDINEEITNKYHTFKITNEFLIEIDNEMVGEFDYFYDLTMNKDISLKTVITEKILEMDSREVFDSL